MLIGEIIKKYRYDNKISQRDFAKRTSLSPSYINTLEKLYNPKTGKPYYVTMEVADQVANAMNMSLNELLKKCDYKPMKDEYNLLIKGDLKYAKLLFKDKKYSREKQIEEIEKNINLLEGYIEFCKMSLNVLRDWETDRMANYNNDIERTQKEILGFKKIREKLLKKNNTI